MKEMMEMGKSMGMSMEEMMEISKAFVQIWSN